MKDVMLESRKFGWFVLIVCGLVIWAALSPHQDPQTVLTKEQMEAQTTQTIEEACHNDWRQCKDNEMLINHYAREHHVMSTCETAAEKLAKYGTPKRGWAAFGYYRNGTDYLTGYGEVVDKDVMFSDMYGAMVHSTAYCKYDLVNEKVVDVFVSAD